MTIRDIKVLRKHLANNLKAGRKARGLSQERLSLDSDVDRSYVGQIERQQGNPSLLVLVALATTLGLDVVDLLASPET